MFSTVVSDHATGGIFSVREERVSLRVSLPLTPKGEAQDTHVGL